MPVVHAPSVMHPVVAGIRYTVHFSGIRRGFNNVYPRGGLPTGYVF